MPDYWYTCPACEKRTVLNHPAGQPPAEPTCPECGQPVRRVYTAPRVNWGGLSPSEMSPGVRALYQDIPKRRAEYDELKASRKS